MTDAQLALQCDQFSALSRASQRVQPRPLTSHALVCASAGRETRRVTSANLRMLPASAHLRSRRAERAVCSMCARGAATACKRCTPDAHAVVQPDSSLPSILMRSLPSGWCVRRASVLMHCSCVVTRHARGAPCRSSCAAHAAWPLGLGRPAARHARAAPRFSRRARTPARPRAVATRRRGRYDAARHRTARVGQCVSRHT
jgi:hypothetical protein